jgi:hypothetical protein
MYVIVKMPLPPEKAAVCRARLGDCSGHFFCYFFPFSRIRIFVIFWLLFRVHNAEFFFYLRYINFSGFFSGCHHSSSSFIIIIHHHHHSSRLGVMSVRDS